MLNFPAPLLYGYSQESAIAEKFQAMIALGEINSLLKDLYDVWLLVSCFLFDGDVLIEALLATFQWRHTAMPTSTRRRSMHSAWSPSARLRSRRSPHLSISPS